MEISNFDKSSVIKKNILLDKFTFLKNQHKSNNNNLFSNDDLLYLLDSYINKIQNIDIDIDINTIKIYFNSLLNLYLFLNMNINILYEEKNLFYLKYDEFNNLILEKLNALNKTNNYIIKCKRKISKLMNEYLINKQLKLSMNINNINSFEECVLNPIFDRYINKDILNNIKNINNLYKKNIKNYENYRYNLNEVYIINDDFINQIMKYNIICKDMKNKYLCNKYMKNTEDINNKIHNNIYNFYIKIFCDYYIKLNKIIIKKISEENLKLFRINKKNSNKKIKEFKEKENREMNLIIQNKVIDLNTVLNEGFMKAEGKNEYLNKKKFSGNILDLSEEFGEKENNNENSENIINNNLDFEERKKKYNNLFNLKEKLLEANKNNNDIIFNLIKIKNEINNKIEEQKIKKKLLNEKYNEIIKNQKNDLLSEKNLLENEFNNLKLKEKEYELKFTELKDKFEQHKNQNKKENEIIVKKINDNEEKEINKKKLDIIPKKKFEKEKEKRKEINSEENKKIKDNINKDIDQNKTNEENKLISNFNVDIPLKKELISSKEKHEIKKEEKENNLNNNRISNQENNLINNNPFSKEKVKEEEKEEDKILKQKRVLDNLPSILSNRNNSKNKKETFSPTIIKRGVINNDNNISMMLSGLNINNNVNINFSDNQKQNNSNDKKNSTNNPSNSDKNPLNIFSQINNNGGNNKNNNIINSNFNNLNNSVNNSNLFTFNSNLNNPFNTNISKKENPFSFNQTNNNNISKSNNIFSQQQNKIKLEQESVFKNFNLSNNYPRENRNQEILFGTHDYNFGKNLINTSNNNFNPISISFNNNNLIGNSLNNNNSISPFTQFNSNQGLINFNNFTQNSNDDNYF